MRKKDDLVGTYEISTGTAEVVADEYHDSGYTLMVNGVPSSHIVLGAPEILEFEYMRWIAAAVETLLPVAPMASHPLAATSLFAMSSLATRPRIRLLPASSFNRSATPWRLEDSTLPIAEITEISKSQSRNWPG